MAHYLFSLGIAPAQDWIESARRARDLRAGSVLLWWLMAGLLGHLRGRLGQEVEVLLPALSGGELDQVSSLAFSDALTLPYSLPNRATGYLPGTPSAAAALTELEQVLAERWEGWRARFIQPGGRLPSWKRGSSSTSRLRRPEQEFWDALAAFREGYEARAGAGGDCPFVLSWVAIPVDSVPGAQVEAELREHLAQIDRRFQAIKRTRPVRPWPAGAPVGKCNQCGRREALGPSSPQEVSSVLDRLSPDGPPEVVPPVFEAWSAWYRTFGVLPFVQSGAMIRSGERLCWVCLAKRMAGYSATIRRRDDAEEVRPIQIPSTGDVAAAPWLTRLRQLARDHETLANALARLEETELGNDDLGRALHLPEDEPPIRARGDDGELLPDPFTREREAVSELRETIRALPAGSGGERIPERPDRYLALLAFDGDGMGEWVLKRPRVVSQAMARFAQEVASGSIGEHLGMPFYLGGDEGLVMAPSVFALPLALELERRFEETFRPCGEAGRSPTLSAGICFFEHTRPVRGALEAARASLELAKKGSYEGIAEWPKNALAISVLTAAGSRFAAMAPFREGGDSRASGGTWQRTETLASWIRSGQLASGWAYEAERFLAGLDPRSWAAFAGDRGPVHSELRRLFVRSVLPEEHERGDARRARALGLWQRLEGDRWFENGAEGVPTIGSDRFHLIGFLARQRAIEGVGPTASGEPS